MTQYVVGGLPAKDDSKYDWFFGSVRDGIITKHNTKNAAMSKAKREWDPNKDSLTIKSRKGVQQEIRGKSNMGPDIFGM